MKRKPSVRPLRTIVVCHGRSEVKIVEYLKQNLRIPIEILSENKGKNSIQIGKSLDRFLNTYLSTKRQLDELGEIEYVQKYPVKLKIFILMDLDDVNDSNMVDNYKNGQLFSKFKFAKSIVPLYEVIGSMGYNPPKHKRDKNKAYTRMFSDGGTVESVEKFLEDCKKCKKTNMELLVQHVINYAVEVGTYNKN